MASIRSRKVAVSGQVNMLGSDREAGDPGLLAKGWPITGFRGLTLIETTVESAFAHHLFDPVQALLICHDVL